MSTYGEDISATQQDPQLGTGPADPDSPEAIRAEIERTRGELSRDVNALGEAVQPGNVAKRQAQKVGGAAANLKDSLKEKVMGSDDPYDSTPGVGDRVSGAAQQVGDRVGGAAQDLGDRAQGVQQQTVRKAQGNPLAAGLIALGAGWLVGSLIPASRKEQELARTAMDNTDKAQPLVDKAKSVAQDAASNLQEPAKEAVAGLKDTAQGAVENVKAEGESQAQQVKDSAKDSKETVQDQAGS